MIGQDVDVTVDGVCEDGCCVWTFKWTVALMLSALDDCRSSLKFCAGDVRDGKGDS